MDKKEMFVVEYSYGQYEDYCEVVHGVVFDQERAQEIVEAETEICSKLRVKSEEVRNRLNLWIAANPQPAPSGFKGERYLAPIQRGAYLSREAQLLRAEAKQHNQALRQAQYAAWRKEYDVVENQLKAEYFTEHEQELYMIGEELAWRWYAVPVL